MLGLLPIIIFFFAQCVVNIESLSLHHSWLVLSVPLPWTVFFIGGCVFLRFWWLRISLLLHSIPLDWIPTFFLFCLVIWCSFECYSWWLCCFFFSWHSCKFLWLPSHYLALLVPNFLFFPFPCLCIFSEAFLSSEVHYSPPLVFHCRENWAQGGKYFSHVLCGRSVFPRCFFRCWVGVCAVPVHHCKRMVFHQLLEGHCGHYLRAW